MIGKRSSTAHASIAATNTDTALSTTKNSVFDSAAYISTPRACDASAQTRHEQRIKTLDDILAIKKKLNYTTAAALPAATIPTTNAITTINDTIPDLVPFKIFSAAPYLESSESSAKITNRTAKRYASIDARLNAQSAQKTITLDLVSNYISAQINITTFTTTPLLLSPQSVTYFPPPPSLHHSVLIQKLSPASPGPPANSDRLSPAAGKLLRAFCLHHAYPTPVTTTLPTSSTPQIHINTPVLPLQYLLPPLPAPFTPSSIHKYPISNIFSPTATLSPPATFPAEQRATQAS
mmetsp:Transcript_36851/g.72481  ORF Transcript_36851/g.72481 Transcript_36851/m.72481 type:complete len:293 (+) Transcript_36851:390-1268(+)